LEEVRLQAIVWVEMLVAQTKRPVVDAVPWQHMIWAMAGIEGIEGMAGMAGMAGMTLLPAAVQYVVTFLARLLVEVETSHHRRIGTRPSLDGFEDSLSLLRSVEQVDVHNNTQRRTEKEARHTTLSLRAPIIVENALSIGGQLDTVSLYDACWWYSLVVLVGGTRWWYSLVVLVGGTRWWYSLVVLVGGTTRWWYSLVVLVGGTRCATCATVCNFQYRQHYETTWITLNVECIRAMHVDLFV
jgi:hypothetical protein